MSYNALIKKYSELGTDGDEDPEDEDLESIGLQARKLFRNFNLLKI